MKRDRTEELMHCMTPGEYLRAHIVSTGNHWLWTGETAGWEKPVVHVHGRRQTVARVFRVYSPKPGFFRCRLKNCVRPTEHPP